MILPAPSLVARIAVSVLPNLLSKASLITLFCTGFRLVSLNSASTSIEVPPPEPGLPLGIVKFKIALVEVPLLVTLALVPGSPVYTLPIRIVAAVPAIPCKPCSPVSPLSPFTPCIPCAPVSPLSPFAPLMFTLAGLSKPVLFVQLNTPEEDTLGTNTLTFSL